MAGRDKQGTGKHGHKDTQEPWPHTDENRQGQGGSRQQAQGDQHRASGKQGGGSQQASDQDRDLKAREYRGEDGQIHHHTHTYMEQHKDKGGGSDKA